LLSGEKHPRNSKPLRNQPAEKERSKRVSVIEPVFLVFVMSFAWRPMQRLILEPWMDWGGVVWEVRDALVSEVRDGGARSIVGIAVS
jgi:hypothetical protein